MPREQPPQPSTGSTSIADANVRGRWLVTTSLVLAALIELASTEADLTVVALLRKDLSSFLVEKAICLAIILTPLLLYIWMNGWRGIIAAKGKITAISIIVVFRLVMDVGCFIENFYPFP